MKFISEINLQKKFSFTPLNLLAAVLITAMLSPVESPVKKNPSPAPTAPEDIRYQPGSAPPYLMSPAETGQYVRYMQDEFPGARERLDRIYRDFIGQPHRQSIIGDYPFEIYPDSLPMFNIESSDCLSYVEACCAMAFSDSWQTFFIMLQRIRYRNGVISWETRNHFIEGDWEKSNSWMFRDVNAGLGKDLLETHEFEVERDRFFKRYGRKNPFPPQKVKIAFFPGDTVLKIIPKLKSGYLFNLIRTNHTGKKWVGHLGFIHVDEDGRAFIVHSGIPSVRMLPFDEYVETQMKARDKNVKEQKPYFAGFRFFSLREDAMEALKKIDGPGAPKLQVYGKNFQTKKRSRG